MIVEIVRRYLGGALLHETDMDNVRSIQQHGILSRKAATEAGVTVVNPGGNALTMVLDDESGLGDAVFLRFIGGGVMPNHGRTRRRRRVTMRIDPEVLLMPGTRIALGFARRRNTRVLGADRALAEMDWQAIEWAVGMETYDRTDVLRSARVAKVYDYEVVVSGRVPPEAILGIEG